jgi:tetratricopeptide (TPR) repeat protein
MKLHAADPADADVLYMLAQEHARAGDQAQAQAWYDRCLSANSDYLYAYFHKARSQQAAGDIPGALATARTGHARARAKGDAKATNELAGLIDELEG